MREIDVRALACPGPVLELRRLLEAGEQAIRLLVADELARSNVTRFATSRGARATSRPGEGGGFCVEVDAAGLELQPVSEAELAALCEPAPPGAARPGPTIVQVSCDRMGRGDDELGGILLRGFLKTLAQIEPRPERVLFYNSGVRLCCAGSALLEDLRALVAAGVEILVCGTCLNFFDLARDLEVGRVTDLLEIATELTQAGRIVRP